MSCISWYWDYVNFTYMNTYNITYIPVIDGDELPYIYSTYRYIFCIVWIVYRCHAKLSTHRALRHKLKSCTVLILYRSDLVKSRRMLYRPKVCNCTMPYVPCTVPAYAVRDPAYTAEVFAAEVFAFTLVQIDVVCIETGLPIIVWGHRDIN